MGKNIYTEEADKLENFKKFRNRKDNSIEKYKTEYSDLVSGFEELLNQTKVITKIGDRLQKRLNEKNEELQSTIEELVRVKISRRATTIVFIIAIAIFFVVEVFIEPIIESHTEFYYGIIIKLVLVLSIKPIEMAFEHKLINRAKRKEILSK